MVNKEEWREIPLHKNYLVSNLGNIKNKTIGNDVKKSKSIHGYYLFTYWSKIKKKSITVTIHSAVASAFIGLRPDGLAIDHIDRNRVNNSVDNLRYCTWRDNASNRKGQSIYGVGIRKTPYNRYQARLYTKGVSHNLGCFKDLESARKARRDFNESHHG